MRFIAKIFRAIIRTEPPYRTPGGLEFTPCRTPWCGYMVAAQASYCCIGCKHSHQLGLHDGSHSYHCLRFYRE